MIWEHFFYPHYRWRNWKTEKSRLIPTVYGSKLQAIHWILLREFTNIIKIHIAKKLRLNHQIPVCLLSCHYFSVWTEQIPKEIKFYPRFSDSVWIYSINVSLQFSSRGWYRLRLLLNQETWMRPGEQGLSLKSCHLSFFDIRCAAVSHSLSRSFQWQLMVK